jgi:hypothetical protein
VFGISSPASALKEQVLVSASKGGGPLGATSASLLDDLSALDRRVKEGLSALDSTFVPSFASATPAEEVEGASALMVSLSPPKGRSDAELSPPLSSSPSSPLSSPPSSPPPSRTLRGGLLDDELPPRVDFSAQSFPSFNTDGLGTTTTMPDATPGSRESRDDDVSSTLVDRSKESITDHLFRQYVSRTFGSESDTTTSATTRSDAVGGRRAHDNNNDDVDDEPAPSPLQRQSLPGDGDIDNVSPAPPSVFAPFRPFRPSVLLPHNYTYNFPSISTTFNNLPSITSLPYPPSQNRS